MSTFQCQTSGIGVEESRKNSRSWSPRRGTWYTPRSRSSPTSYRTRAHHHDPFQSTRISSPERALTVAPPPAPSPGAPASRPGTLPAFLALVVTLSIYGCNFVAIRYSVQNGLSSFDLVALRFLVAGVVMLPLFIRLGPRDLGGIGWRRGLILATLAGSPYMALFFGGLHFAPASHGAILNPGMVPIVVFLALVLSRRQPFSLARMLILLMIVVGLVLVTASSFTLEGDVLIGDALLLLSGVSWGLFTLLARIWQLRPLQSATIVSVISLLYLPVYFLFIFDGFESATLRHIITQGAFQGLVNAIATMFLITFAIERLGAQVASLFTPLVPVVTTILGVFLLEEIPTPLQGVGMVIVVAGMIVATRSTRPSRHDADLAEGPRPR